MNKFNESINEEFEKAYLFFQKGKFIIDECFKKALFAFFDKYNSLDNWEQHDKIFQKFGHFWHYLDGNSIIIRPFQLCDYVFEKIFSLVDEWESKNPEKHIHKGTPYYFYGMICILKQDIDKGLLLMHQAYQEDELLFKVGKRTDKTPAMCFIYLDDTKAEQFFRGKVIETVQFLNYYLSKYGTLNISQLRANLFEDDNFKEESFYFVYCIFKLEKLITKINKNLKENILASYINTAIIFELCKLAEVLLKRRYQKQEILMINKYNKNSKNKGLDFIHYIDYFCQDTSIHLSLRTNNIGYLNKELKNNQTFSSTIKGIANHSYSHNNFVSSPLPIEYDIALTYCLRNFGGHTIKDQRTLSEEFEKIVISILNFIFLIIEKK